MLKPESIKCNHILPIIFILGFFMFSAPLAGQDRKSNLQEEKKQIESQIAYTNDLLQKTRKTRQNSMDGLVILQQKIRQRERLINTIESELILTDEEIEETGDSIFLLQVELKKLKEEYASIIYYANRNRNSYDRLVFIFSSEDFNQAYRRIKYFQQYNNSF